MFFHICFGSFEHLFIKSELRAKCIAPFSFYRKFLYIFVEERFVGDFFFIKWNLFLSFISPKNPFVIHFLTGLTLRVCVITFELLFLIVGDIVDVVRIAYEVAHIIIVFLFLNFCECNCFFYVEKIGEN